MYVRAARTAVGVAESQVAELRVALSVYISGSVCLGLNVSAAGVGSLQATAAPRLASIGGVPEAHPPRGGIFVRARDKVKRVERVGSYEGLVVRQIRCIRADPHIGPEHGRERAAHIRWRPPGRI